MPAELAGWMAVVAGFAAYAMLMRWLDPIRKVAVSNAISPVVQVRPFEEGVEFQKVMAVSLAQLKCAPDPSSSRGDAELQIDAAKYALGRIVADLAKIGIPIVAPTFEPLRQLVREPAPVPAQRQPLAA